MIIDLLLITVAVSLVFLSGFPDEMDRMVNKRFPLYHIPQKPFRCCLCMSFWTMILYLIVTQQFTLISISCALGLAYGSDIVQNCLVLIKECFSVCIGRLMNFLNRDIY